MGQVLDAGGRKKRSKHSALTAPRSSQNTKGCPTAPNNRWRSLANRTNSRRHSDTAGNQKTVLTSINLRMKSMACAQNKNIL